MTQGYVALLRGVNVGGARPLPMERLRALFAEAGAKSVESLIQSGNVVFAATEASAPQILADVGARISREFGFAAPMVLRDATAWKTLIDGNPFLGDGADPDTLHALCLSETPSPDALARLDPSRSPGDEFRGSRPRYLSASALRRRPHEADQRLVRLETAGHVDVAQLAHRS